MVNEDAALPFRPLATWAIIAINCAVFLSMVAQGAPLLLPDPSLLVDMGGLTAERAWNGEVWRIASAMFVHGAVWHLGLNMWVLFAVGGLLERVLGRPRYVLLYLLSGGFGFAMSMLTHPGLTVGASGAIFGVTGGLFALAAISRGQRISRVLLSSLTPFVIGTLVIGFLVSFVDNSAHVGGFALGFLLAYGLLGDHPERFAEPGTIVTRPRFAGLSLAAALVLSLGLISLSLKPVFSPSYQVTMGYSALHRGSADKARARADQAAKLAPQDGAVLVLLGRMAELDDDARSARRFYRQALMAFDADDGEEALVKALLAIGGAGTDPFDFDVPTTLGLCEAALDRKGDKPNANLLNNCAWTMVKDDPAAGDPARALVLARRAVSLVLGGSDAASRLSDGQKVAAAAYLHTLATCYARMGDLTEAVAILDRISAEGLDDRPAFRSDRDRFERRRLRERRNLTPPTDTDPDAADKLEGPPRPVAPASPDAGE